MKKINTYCSFIIAVFFLCVFVVLAFSGCMLTEKSQQRNFSKCIEKSINEFKKEDSKIVIDTYRYPRNEHVVCYMQGLLMKVIDKDNGEETWNSWESGIVWLYLPQKYWPNDKRPRFLLYEKTRDEYLASHAFFITDILDKIKEHAEWFEYDKESKFYISKAEFRSDLLKTLRKSSVKIKFTDGLITEYEEIDDGDFDDAVKTENMFFSYNQDFQLTVPQHEEEYTD